jgi:undecaprenol kinase
MPKPTTTSSVRSFLNSLNYAFKGIKHVFRNERNFRLHTASSVIVLLLAVYFRCDLFEFIVLIIVISSVLVAEMINSAIEYTWNKLEPQHHPVVGMIKDIMAGSVMIASMAALIVGVLVIMRHMI